MLPDVVSGVPQYVFGRNSSLDPAEGAHSTPLDLLAELRGPTCKRRECRGNERDKKG